MSVLGTIQPFTLSHVFGSAEREAGLLARILLAYPPDQPTLWSESELSDEVVTKWRELLAGLLTLAPALDDADRPKPRLIPMASDAKKKFVSWHDCHAREVADLADDHLRAHWSKLKGVCARIPLLFSCAEAVEGQSVSSVSLDSLQRAIEVTEWLKAESARIYAGLGESDTDRDHQRLVEWIEKRGGTVTVRDLTHNLSAFRGKSAGASAALDGLVKLGIGQWVHPPANTDGGRPSKRFELVKQTPPPTPTPKPRPATS